MAAFGVIAASTSHPTGGLTDWACPPRLASTTPQPVQVQGLLVPRAEGTATLMPDRDSLFAEALLRPVKTPVNS